MSMHPASVAAVAAVAAVTVTGALHAKLCVIKNAYVCTVLTKYHVICKVIDAELISNSLHACTQRTHSHTHAIQPSINEAFYI